MKRSMLSAALATSLALTPHVICAAAESAKGPLTDADKAQCGTQLAEFNQGIRTYNADLDVLKALETEIDTLSAAIEKERAVMERGDRAAMQALNAQIDKNNELVARHKQMIVAIKAKSEENKQRRAQFTETCENRTLAAAQPVKALPSDSACNSATGAKEVERRIEATFAEMRADQKKHEAEVTRVAEARAKTQSWSKEKRGKIWLQLMGSPKFMAFEREKEPYMQELMSILGSNPKNSQEECRIVQRIAAMLPAIKAVNARQYAYMADEIRAAR